MNWEKISSFFDDNKVKALREGLLKDRGYLSVDEYLTFPRGIESKKKLDAFRAEVLFLYERFDFFLLKDQISITESPLHFLFIPFSNYALTYIRPSSMLSDDKIIYKVIDSIIEKFYNSYHGILEEELKIYINELQAMRTIETERLFVLEASESIEWYNYLFDKYPVFFDRVHKILNHYIQHINNFFSRLTADIDQIILELLSDLENPKIIDIKPNLGDFHNNCQSTIGIIFENNVEVFYKARSSRGEKYFFSLMNNLWQTGLPKSLVEITSIDKMSYSWHKGIREKELEFVEQASSFYFNQGINCYLAYIFGIQDLIVDNIIAVGETPCFFDLEILLHPKYQRGNNYKDSSQTSVLFINGILKTGLLPQFGFETINDSGYSNGGLSILEDHQRHSNIPIYKSKQIGIDQYVENFLSGFEYMHSFILKNKEIVEKQIKSSDPIICRVLIRYTNIYTRLLTKLSTQTFLQSFTAEAYLLEMLWRGYHPVHMPAEVIQSEIDQLLNGDIPFFQVWSDSTDLLGPDGEIVFKKFFNKTGLDFAIEKMRNFEIEENYQIQLNTIKRSFTIHENVNLKLENGIVSGLGKDNLVESIAEYLLNLGASNDRYFTYIDYTITKDSMWNQGIQDSDLFNGIPGIGLFLLAYYKESDDKRYLSSATKIYDQSVEYFLDCWNEIKDNPTTDIGTFHFPISILYMSMLYRQIDNRFSFALAPETEGMLIEYIELKLHKDEKRDYLFGATGVGLLLIEFEKESSFPHKIRYLIEEIAEYLLEKSSLAKNFGITWETTSFNKWGGFAHGTASTSYFLFKVHDLTGNKRYFDAGVEALKYDQSLYNKELGFWQKTEDFVGEVHHGWASGVAGILLSRHLISNFYTNDFLHFEIEEAKKILIDVGMLYVDLDHSLCSGFFGILEIYETVLGKDNITQVWRQKYTDVVKDLSMVKCGGWNKHQVLNGFFYGIAGIGYGLLKNYKNTSLPSMLYM
ncbi:type 2 lanthipeptide synthetase LanM [Sphingobacterium ginsenosidimutans]|uniref:Lantibiotic biosynthesis protein dehydration domain-containing protein n=1 Tax=Sphingobacterium ginsenosidimutans TaxID=687845 RepID=A0ABP8AEY5_9SPHI